jgi:hypothetical protein
MKLKRLLAALVVIFFVGAELLVTKPKIAFSADFEPNNGMPERIWINTLWCVNGQTSMTAPGYLSYFDDFMDDFGCRVIKLQGLEAHITDAEILADMKNLGALDDYYDSANLAHVYATFLGIQIKGSEGLFRQWAIDAEAVANWYVVKSKGSFEGYERRGELESYLNKWRQGSEVRMVSYEKRRN